MEDGKMAQSCPLLGSLKEFDSAYAHKVNAALARLGSKAFAVCSTKFKAGSRTQRDISWRRAADTCDERYLNIRYIPEKDVANWLKRNYDASLASLLKNPEEYSKKLLEQHNGMTVNKETGKPFPKEKVKKAKATTPRKKIERVSKPKPPKVTKPKPEPKPAETPKMKSHIARPRFAPGQTPTEAQFKKLYSSDSFKNRRTKMEKPKVEAKPKPEPKPQSSSAEDAKAAQAQAILDAINNL